MSDKVKKGIIAGKVTTIEQYFAENPQRVHTASNNPNRKAVMLNGTWIEIGSPQWQMVAKLRVYQDDIFGELRILYHNNNDKGVDEINS
jgi:hypothetical protein